MNSYPCKLASLREAMKVNKTDVYIIPSTDPHLGENIPDHWRIIEWLTGFTGSSGTVIVTDSFAGLWTDSRYFIQAEEQLKGTGFVLMKPLPYEISDFTIWLKENIKVSGKIAFDGRLLSISRLRKLDSTLSGMDLITDINQDLISEIWTDRPLITDSKAYEHDIAFCGIGRSEKIDMVKKKMNQSGVDYHLLCCPDDIMWLLNIRGNDVTYSPLLSSFAIIGEDQILLFVNEDKIPFKIASEFDKLSIVILPYQDITGIISSLPEDSTILLSPSSTSASIYRSIPESIKIREDITIPARLKSVKNKTEIASIGNVMIKDGTALTKFFFWLEKNVGSEILTELTAGEKLEELRSQQDRYIGPSFRTIAAYNEHGALPHYASTPETDMIISGRGMLLIDSGGQYLDGTTDITRTIAFGNPSSQQKKDFTLVLKGMISLAMAKFPAGTRGFQLDILARKDLWDNGLNYGHGTGHGVGFFLNVHEGPQSISPGSNPDSKTVIMAGMLISDEPAIYREGEYGIRTENLILCYEDEETEFGQFLKFDTVSLCYIEKSLIDDSMLEPGEIDWLNRYHSEVYEKLSPYLAPEEKEWLKEKTGMI